jgi:BMFP domain-containing protein YqiC
MLDPKRLDDLARRLAENAPKGFQVLQDDLSRSFRATLEAGLTKLDLVTREEFDVQAAVLARSRSKLEALERRVTELEQALSQATTAPPSGQAAATASKPARDASSSSAEDNAPEAPSA